MTICTTECSDRIEILCTDELRIQVGPPDYQPENLACEAIQATMPTETKMPPLVMLVHRPKVVDTSGIKSMPDEVLCHLPLNIVRFNRLEI
jgi:hypothetical protein